MMNRIHFSNHQNVIFESLYSSKKSVIIAVAWLNFELYEQVFLDLEM